MKKINSRFQSLWLEMIREIISSKIFSSWFWILVVRLAFSGLINIVLKISRASEPTKMSWSGNACPRGSRNRQFLSVAYFAQVEICRCNSGNRKLRRESTRIYSKKEKDMEANASTNAEFVLATLGNDAGMYGAVKMVL